MYVADTLNGGAIKPGAAAASAMTLDAWILSPATDRDIEDVLSKSTCINNRMTVVEQLYQVQRVLGGIGNVLLST